MTNTPTHGVTYRSASIKQDHDELARLFRLFVREPGAFPPFDSRANDHPEWFSTRWPMLWTCYIDCADRNWTVLDLIDWATFLLAELPDQVILTD